MLFQRTIFTRNTIWQQYRHLVSEVIEVGIAILKAKSCEVISEFSPLSNVDIQKRWNHVADELVDTQQSADTALRIILEQHRGDSHGAYTRVIIGCTKRGYYGEVECNTQN